MPTPNNSSHISSVNTDQRAAVIAQVENLHWQYKMSNILMKNRKNYHHGDLRTALIGAGLEILANDGVDALTLRAVAAKVGVSHTAPKNHFDNVKALWTAMATEGFWRLAQSLKTAASKETDPDLALRATSTAYSEFASSEPALFQLMFSPSRCDHDNADLSEAALAACSVLQQVTRDLDWPAADSTATPKQAQMMLWSLIHGHAALANGGFLNMTAEGAPTPHIAELLPHVAR